MVVAGRQARVAPGNCNQPPFGEPGNDPTARYPGSDRQAGSRVGKGAYMIGIVIVTHANLGDALIDAAAFVLGDRPDATTAISIDINENAAVLRRKINKGIKSVSGHHGVLILTDMFGGTPSNLSYSFLEEGRIEVLSGVNLPILVKALNDRGKKQLAELVIDLEAFGKKSIGLASSILKGNKRA
jgi:PTS system mannose-specific IIA component